MDEECRGFAGHFRYIFAVVPESAVSRETRLIFTSE
jgi:hypothetical protein